MIEWMMTYPGCTTFLVFVALVLIDDILTDFFKIFRKNKDEESDAKEKEEKTDDTDDNRSEWIRKDKSR